MIEVGVISDPVHPDPFDGKPGFIGLLDLGKSLTVWSNRLVTIHTRLCRRHCSVGGSLNGVVAVPAIKTELTCMQRMTEGNRLNRLVTNFKCPWTKPVRNKHHCIQR